jgi:DNA polymerase I-like protein with 3'-5' exonuclease and polymerase domains
MLAVTLSRERHPAHLDAKLVIACHDELVIECPEDQAEEVARFVAEVMVAGMNEVLNYGLDVDHPDRVPVDVDVEILESWGPPALRHSLKRGVSVIFYSAD